MPAKGTKKRTLNADKKERERRERKINLRRYSPPSSETTTLDLIDRPVQRRLPWVQAWDIIERNMRVQDTGMARQRSSRGRVGTRQ